MSKSIEHKKKSVFLRILEDKRANVFKREVMLKN